MIEMHRRPPAAKVAAAVSIVVLAALAGGAGSASAQAGPPVNLARPTLTGHPLIPVAPLRGVRLSVHEHRRRDFLELPARRRRRGLVVACRRDREERARQDHRELSADDADFRASASAAAPAAPASAATASRKR
jgi:hypothetical protein